MAIDYPVQLPISSPKSVASDQFRVTEHTVQCQHIREYPHATAASQEDPLYLAVKQYTPFSNASPTPGDVTIVVTTANAMPKEAYEPLFEELVSASRASDHKIRGIWVADMAHEGASSVLNEKHLGNDPHWFDHSRDLLLLINNFSASMPQPIIGIGHSLGCAQLVFLSQMHPRLFSCLILIEPWISPKAPPSGALLAKASTFRHDIWPSREDAEAAIRRSPLLSTWDPSALSRFLQHGLRKTPTLIHPNADPQAVTLTTPKHQESFTIYRSNWDFIGVDGPPSRTERATRPDVNPQSELKAPFYNTGREQAFQMLPGLRPPVLYVWGQKSMLASKAFRAEKLAATGVGFGGSGGVKLGQVSEVVVPGSHFVPMERPKEITVSISKWVGEKLRAQKESLTKLDEEQKGMSKRERQMMSKEWVETMRKWDGRPVTTSSKL